MTPAEALVSLAGVGVAAAAIACARSWMARTADLGLGLFRPWAGDPWPIGVQEDDDFRFRWSTPANDAGNPAGDPPAGGAFVQRVSGISVRRVRR